MFIDEVDLSDMTEAELELLRGTNKYASYFVLFSSELLSLIRTAAPKFVETFAVQHKALISEFFVDTAKTKSSISAVDFSDVLLETFATFHESLEETLLDSEKNSVADLMDTILTRLTINHYSQDGSILYVFIDLLPPKMQLSPKQIESFNMFRSTTEFNIHSIN